MRQNAWKRAAGMTAAWSVLMSGPVRGQVEESGAMRLEVAVGAASDPGVLGHTGVLVEGGYLHLGAPGVVPLLRFGVSSGRSWRGLRPALLVSWAPARRLAARWNPCAPGSFCPSILAEPNTRTSRTWGVAGVEAELPVGLGPVVPAVFVGAGVDRVSVAWREWGEVGGLHLAEGSAATHEALLEGGLTLTVGAGPWRLLGRLDASTSRFGPGRVESGVPVDLGRRSITTVAASMGVRWSGSTR
ncbi:MAG: hypothetical protein RLN75_06765 [Longimicrobiales bacterium]